MTVRERLVEVYRAANEMEALVIKGLLETEDIACVLTSNTSYSAYPITVDGLGEVRVLVLESVARQARDILASRQAINPPPPEGEG